MSRSLGRCGNGVASLANLAGFCVMLVYVIKTIAPVHSLCEGDYTSECGLSATLLSLMALLDVSMGVSAVAFGVVAYHGGGNQQRLFNPGEQAEGYNALDEIAGQPVEDIETGHGELSDDESGNDESPPAPSAKQ